MMCFIHGWRRGLWKTGRPSFLVTAAVLFCAGCAATAPSGKRARLPFPGRRTSAPPQTNIAAHVVSYDEYRDPLKGFNRAMFAFNDAAYRYVLIPVGQGYLWIMPDPAERSIANFFYNLQTPIFAVNHLLQARPKPAGKNVLRLVVNSTVGLLGLFDPAEEWFGIERAETHLDDTLARYGLGYGIYLVLPIFGPSDIRNTVSTVGEFFAHPVPYLIDEPISTSVQSFDYLQEFAPGSDRYRELHRESEDPYIFFRNLYLQGVQRDAAHP